MSDRIRITGGSRRNKRLHSPPKDTIRPASDMIRQAVFNMFGDVTTGCVFYDVFAGTGIVGIEALSRGADRAVFLELERRYVILTRKNVELAGMAAQSSIRAADAFIWAKHFVPEPGKVIVFLGPPYPMFEGNDRQRLLQLIADVAAKLDDDDWLVLQMPKELSPDDLPARENWVRLRKYGKTIIGIWRKGGAEGDPIWTPPSRGGPAAKPGDDDETDAGDDENDDDLEIDEDDEFDD